MKDKNISRIHSLYELFVNRYTSPQEAYRAILNKGLKAFNLSLGIISKVEGDHYFLLSVFPLNRDISEGQVFELKKPIANALSMKKRSLVLSMQEYNLIIIRIPFILT
uniref:Uncharacterized protein n=2 Tax=Escherichia coli TaxID=562 RepID=I3VZW6_ECOLX|nr:hypothetical protein [Escherichia coli]